MHARQGPFAELARAEAIGQVPRRNHCSLQRRAAEILTEFVKRSGHFEALVETDVQHDSLTDVNLIEVRVIDRQHVRLRWSPTWPGTYNTLERLVITRDSTELAQREALATLVQSRNAGSVVINSVRRGSAIRSIL